MHVTLIELSRSGSVECIKSLTEAIEEPACDRVSEAHSESQHSEQNSTVPNQVGNVEQNRVDQRHLLVLGERVYCTRSNDNIADERTAANRSNVGMSPKVFCHVYIHTRFYQHANRAQPRYVRCVLSTRSLCFLFFPFFARFRRIAAMCMRLTCPLSVT